jgi:NAD+ synthase (glutamine-hydrolysing)
MTTVREFRNLHTHGFARVAACTVPVAMADPATNAARIAEQVQALHDDGVDVALFPELSLSGYAIDDLLLQDVLLDAVDQAVVDLARATAKLRPVVVVGAPIRSGARLYNCAVVLHRGEVLGVVPKVNLPNYREFYEKRWFASGDDARGTMLTRAHWPGADEDGDVPFGPDLIFRADRPARPDDPRRGLRGHVGADPPERTKPPSPAPTVLLNLSASPITVARAEDRHLLARSASSRCNAAYLYAAASAGESTTDLSWDGMTMVYEMGDLLGQSARFPEGAASHSCRHRPGSVAPGANSSGHRSTTTDAAN